MCDEECIDVEGNLFSWAQEVFHNLSQVKDLIVLDDLNISLTVRRLYANLAPIALQLKSQWQAYAAAVIWRVQSNWI